MRGCGLIAAVELVADRKTKAPLGTIGKMGRYLAGRAQEHGMITRPIGDSIAFCPPLISTQAEIQLIVDTFGRSLEDTARWIGQSSN